jgi:tetratricopeptide (TPR) repeat protein
VECEIVCVCGKSICVTEAMAGASLTCNCGKNVVVPPKSKQTEGIVLEDAIPPADLIPQLEGKPEPVSRREILAPTPVSMLSRRGRRSIRRKKLMAGLTSDAVWIQDIWRLHFLSLNQLELERSPQGKGLILKPLAPESSGESLTISFTSQAIANRWFDEIQKGQSASRADVEPVGRVVPDGVALICKSPDVSYVGCGRVTFLHGMPWSADRGAQLCAAMRGADAILGLTRKKLPEMESGTRQVGGLAVRVEDADERKRVRWTWYTEEVKVLVNRTLWLVLTAGLLLFLAAAFLPGKTYMMPATGESNSQAIGSAGLAVGIFFGWPLLLILLLRVVRWRELLPPVGIAVLAVTTLRGLTVMGAHLLAIAESGAGPAEGKIAMLVDPVEWTLIIAGAVLTVRALRLRSRSSQILPEDALIASLPRKLWSRGILTATVLFAVFCPLIAGVARYEMSHRLLQKGIDPQREHQALLALNEGADHADQGDLVNAEKSFQRALRLWKELTAPKPAPLDYRLNLILTLRDLGWVRLKQKRYDEADSYYSQAVALADELKGNPGVDLEEQKTMEEARRTLARLREQKASKLERMTIESLNQKDREAERKYEEAEVKMGKDDPDSERLFAEAIAAWEEVLPHANIEDYRKSTTGRLALAWLHIGQVQEWKGKSGPAEESLKKAIDYGEKAVALDPSRQLYQHNLQVARRALEELRDQAFQVEVEKLARAERFLDLVDLFTHDIEAKDRLVRAGKDVELVLPILAHRLDRLAWLMAHCPNRHIRDTKAAVEHSRRATELYPKNESYWYTLAMVQFRNSDWKDSLATLDRLKAIENRFGAHAWFVSAMNLHHLGRVDEARAALRKANDWMDNQERKAQADVQIRLEYELIRPSLERLLQETRELLRGETKLGLSKTKTLDFDSSIAEADVRFAPCPLDCQCHTRPGPQKEPDRLNQRPSAMCRRPRARVQENLVRPNEPLQQTGNANDGCRTSTTFPA